MPSRKGMACVFLDATGISSHAIFKSSGKKNYSIEILTFLLQHDYLLSECQAHELIWSRFVNTHGFPGCNIPNDLHCEHLNCLCKTAVKGLGANKTEECIQRVAKAIGTMDPLLEQFDRDNMVGHRAQSCQCREGHGDYRV